MFKLFRPVLYVCGILACVMAGLLLIPALYSWWVNDNELEAFFLASACVAVCGILMLAPGYTAPFSLNARQLYLLTSLSWLQLSFYSALPLVLVDHPLSFSDAVFEAVSGITTTGSTVLSQLNTLPPSILLWRSMLQWIGGFGVIGMAVSILPFLRVGGMRLFQTESSDWSDKSLPQFHDMARGLMAVYLGMTTLCALAYWLAGMNGFDAINHAMTTVSTGGYATDDSSMGRFNYGILWISTVFMLLGGMPFTLFIRFLTTRRLDMLKDQQVTAFLTIVLFLVAILTLQQVLAGNSDVLGVLTHTAFNIVSVITTTGFASQDYTQWGMFAVAMFFFVTFMGGCSGSTSGGMKIFRFQLSWLFLRDQMNKLVHPRGMFTVRYNGKAVSDDIMGSAVAFSFLFFLVLTFTTLALALTGLDFVTAFTGAATALANVGPGLGDMIGPAGNFAAVPESGKWILCFAMILGRLELLTVMVLLTPVFWKG
ncbi:TrkH family potassium uptake protein [Thalassolituus sp. LLYu03]|uniref:TrkH family potassium uptake protein n=1 Tax=Thalassolituus sp. LLYu03 TaxID=3421656 RepID=UPI003D2D160A